MRTALSAGLGKALLNSNLPVIDIKMVFWAFPFLILIACLIYDQLRDREFKSIAPLFTGASIVPLIIPILGHIYAIFAIARIIDDAKDDKETRKSHALNDIKSIEASLDKGDLGRAQDKLHVFSNISLPPDLKNKIDALGVRIRAHQTSLKAEEERRKEASAKAAEERIKAREEALREMLKTERILNDATPREFEVLVVKAFTALGYDAITTPYIKDGGVDGMMKKSGLLYLVQCKKQKAPVGEPALRDFYGAMMHHRCAYGIFITTSNFTSHAIQFSRGKNIELVARKQTLALLKNITT